MSWRDNDEWKAGLAAVALLALAAIVALWVHPDGQGQAKWFFALLPGAFAAPGVLDVEWALFHRAGPVVMWTTAMVFSYGWYFVLSYGAIAIGHVVSHRKHRVRAAGARG